MLPSYVKASDFLRYCAPFNRPHWHQPNGILISGNINDSKISSLQRVLQMGSVDLRCPPLRHPVGEVDVLRRQAQKAQGRSGLDGWRGGGGSDKNGDVPQPVDSTQPFPHPSTDQTDFWMNAPERAVIHVGWFWVASSSLGTISNGSWDRASVVASHSLGVSVSKRSIRGVFF